MGKDRYGCAGRRVQICDNARTIGRQAVETRILSVIKERLLSPEAIEAAVDAARRALAEHHREAVLEEARLRRRSGELVRAINRMIDLVVEGTAAAAVRERMAEAEAERLRIEVRLTELKTADEAIPAVPHPRIAEAYRRQVENLEGFLCVDTTEAREALEVVRGLIQRVERKRCSAALLASAR